MTSLNKFGGSFLMESTASQMVLSSLNWLWALSVTVEGSCQSEAGLVLENVGSHSTARRYEIMTIEAICLINCGNFLRRVL
jgi:hypothetical protein